MTSIAEREAFLAERLTGIGGSDCAASLGLSRWKTQARLAREKLGLEAPEDLSADVAVELGSRLEDVIADMYAARHGCAVRRDNRTLRHPQYPFMMAHIDRRVVGQRILLECKTAGLVSGRPDPDWGDGKDEVPRDYFLQAQHYLAVCGLQVCHVPAIIAGKGYIEYEILRDDELIAMIIEGELVFWEMLQAGIEPPVVSVEDAQRRWPKSVASEIQASTQIIDVDQKLRTLEAQARDIESQIDDHKTALMAYMAENDTLVFGKQKLRSWKSQSTTRCDVTALKEQRPDIYEKFSKTTEGRVFRKVEIK